MRREDLFNAIGMVEESRLARCEKNQHPFTATGRANSKVKTGGKYAAKSKRKGMSKVWLVAAIIAAMVLLMGCAIVLKSLGMLSMGTTNVDIPIDYHNSVTEERSVLSLQGYQGTPGYQAALEWNQFLDTYDPDGSILASLPDKKNTGIPAEYSAYSCYTQEMKAKIDEICAKYGLELLGKSYLEDTNEEFFGALGIDGIIVENAQAEVVLYPEYYYRDGTFVVYGLTTLTGDNTPWQFPIEFNLRCVMKSSFDCVTNHIKDLSGFTEWTYTLSDGTEVLLALSKEGAFIIADCTDCFITITLETTVQKWYMDEPVTMDKAALEAVANTFDLTFHPQKPDVAAAEAREEARYQEYLRQTEAAQKANEEFYGKGSYAERIRYNIQEEYRSDRYGYVLMDLDGNGIAELLIGQDGWFKHLYTVSGETTTALIDANILPYANYYLCEGNIIAMVVDQHTYQFGKVVGDHMQWDVILEYDDRHYPEHPWRKIHYDGYIKDSDPIPESEFNAIIHSYKRVVIDTTPLSEFPQETEVVRSPDKMYPDIYRNFEEMILSRLDSDERDAYSFALLDFDGDGQEELIVYERTFTSIYTMTDGVLNTIISAYDITICEENIIKKTMRYSEDTYAVCYYQIVEGNQTKLVEYLRYDADRDPMNPWFRSTDASGFDGTLVPITEHEFDRIMDSYKDVGLEMKPLSEYPFDE